MTIGHNLEEKVGKQKPGKKEQVDFQAEDVVKKNTQVLKELQVICLLWSLK